MEMSPKDARAIEEVRALVHGVFGLNQYQKILKEYQMAIVNRPTENQSMTFSGALSMVRPCPLTSWLIRASIA